MREQKEMKRLEADQRKAGAKVKRDREQKVKELEHRIHECEAKQRALTAELEAPETYSNGRAVPLNRELLAVQETLEKITAEWESLAT